MKTTPSLLGLLLAACSLVGTPLVAQADTVTFEDVPLWTTGKFASGGYDFILNGGYAFIVNSQVCDPPCPVNGTNEALIAGSVINASLQMYRADGGTFNLLGFDGSGSFNTNQQGRGSWIPNQIDVVGVQNDGTAVTQSFLIDKSAQSGPLPFTSYLFNGSFTDLVFVSFTSSGSANWTYNGLTIDNISASVGAPVPEPGTYALMLMGLGAVGFVARRRKPYFG